MATKREWKMLKICLFILEPIAVFAFGFSVFLYAWWQKEHLEPGLAAMIEPRTVTTNIVISAISLVLITLMLLLSAAMERKSPVSLSNENESV